MKTKELLQFLKDVEKLHPEFLESEINVFDFTKKYELDLSYYNTDDNKKINLENKGINLVLRRSNVEF